MSRYEPIKNRKETINDIYGNALIIQDDIENFIVYYITDEEEPVPPTPTAPSITLNKSTVSLTPDATETLTATTVPANAEVSWSSSDETVATVEGGVVTAVADGSATITASITVEDVAYTDTCAVTVATANANTRKKATK